jgi:signal transduction histidine kinase
MNAGAAPSPDPDRERALRVPRQVYRLRVFGLALGAICIGTVFGERGASPLAWSLLAAHEFVWPHVAWLRARTSADPHRAERQHLLVDSAVGGVFVALMHFALLPSVLVVGMLTMDKIGWGVAFLGRACGAMAAACLLTALLVGAPPEPYTSMTMIVGSLPLMVAYPIAVAFVSERSGRLARERRKTVEQMAALREQLAHIARVGTLGEMAAGLAHELNQPLTAIHFEAHAAMALDPMRHTRELGESLNRIGEQSLRAGDIVRRMRTFARSGRTRREHVEVRQLVNEVLALLDHDLRLAGVRTRVLLADHVPPALVDRIQIQQVLVNLIRNAIEAMTRSAPGSRELTIRSEAAPDAIRLSVTDTGGGVDPIVASRLFHPFQSTKAEGLGLGLSICQTLVEAHGGRVGAGPHPAGGATFFFELPTTMGQSSG